MGRRVPASASRSAPDTAQMASTAARSRAIRANGLSLRRLRSRSRRTAASLRASQAR